ncbi:MAG: Urease accessory protein UreE [Acetobacteraceae bacterium]|nr:Urease accessory protein UreE [Acetobacteraceae bacterium]
MRARAVARAGSWDQEREVGRILIDSESRHRRRVVLCTEGGEDVLLDLPQAVLLKEGDGLCLDDGGIIRVCARPEPLIEIRALDEGALARIAWHLGNRHLPVQFVNRRIRIRADAVIEEMIAGLGGQVERVEAAFDPEPGAYAGHLAHHHHADDDAPHD